MKLSKDEKRLLVLFAVVLIAVVSLKSGIGSPLSFVAGVNDNNTTLLIPCDSINGLQDISVGDGFSPHVLNWYNPNGVSPNQQSPFYYPNYVTAKYNYTNSGLAVEPNPYGSKLFNGSSCSPALCPVTTTVSGFCGTAAYFQASDSPDWYLGSNDFTIDFDLFYTNVISSGLNLISHLSFPGVNEPTVANSIHPGSSIPFTESSEVYGWTIEIIPYGSSSLIRFVSAHNNTLYGSSLPISANTWNHVAVVRHSNQITIYINGVGGPITNIAGSIEPSFQGTPLEFDFSYSSMAQIRFSSVARWTTNFTPPTAPYVSTPVGVSQVIYSTTSSITNVCYAGYNVFCQQYPASGVYTYTQTSRFGDPPIPVSTQTYTVTASNTTEVATSPIYVNQFTVGSYNPTAFLTFLAQTSSSTQTAASQSSSYGVPAWFLELVSVIIVGLGIYKYGKRKK